MSQPLHFETIFDSYCDGVTLASDSAGIAYAYGAPNRVGSIARREGPDNWKVIYEFKNDGSGVEGSIGGLICQADGSILVALSTRRDGQEGDAVVLPGLCTPAPLLSDLYRGDYQSDAELNGAPGLFVRFNKFKTFLLRLADGLVARGLFRRG